jgi:hypothetical protein
LRSALRGHPFRQSSFAAVSDLATDQYEMPVVSAFLCWTRPDWIAAAIHVLHAFEKKTQKTARRDLELAAARLRKLKRGSK